MAELVTERAAPVFVARGLTKIYQMGEVRVEALRGIDVNQPPLPATPIGAALITRMRGEARTMV